VAREKIGRIEREERRGRNQVEKREEQVRQERGE
jgi:hypothetical protein